MHYMELAPREQANLKRRLVSALRAYGLTEKEVKESVAIAEVSKVSDIVSTIVDLRSSL